MVRVRRGAGRGAPGLDICLESSSRIPKEAKGFLRKEGGAPVLNNSSGAHS